MSHGNLHSIWHDNFQRIAVVLIGILIGSADAFFSFWNRVTKRRQCAPEQGTHERLGFD
jgi:hypothetical protein